MRLDPDLMRVRCQFAAFLFERNPQLSVRQVKAKLIAAFGRDMRFTKIQEIRRATQTRGSSNVQENQ